jgi:hypothetical protein
MATTERKLMAATPVTFIDVYRIHEQDARELADMKLRLIGLSGAGYIKSDDPGTGPPKQCGRLGRRSSPQAAAVP